MNADALSEHINGAIASAVQSGTISADGIPAPSPGSLIMQYKAQAIKDYEAAESSRQPARWTCSAMFAVGGLLTVILIVERSIRVVQAI